MATALLEPSAATQAPGPRGTVAMVRNLRRLQADAARLFLDLHRQHGDVVRLPLGPYLTHLNLAPDGVRHVLQTNAHNYVRGRMYERFKLFFGIGLLTTDGEEWRGHRRVVNPMFHRTSIDSMAADMTAATARVLDRWHGVASRGEAVDVIPEMMDVSLTALGSIVFDTDLWPHRSRVAPAMATSIEAMIFKGTAAQLAPDWLPTRYNRRIRRAQQVLDARVGDIVAAHRRGEHARLTDLVNLLLSARDADTGEPLPERHVHDEIKTIFMAGHETTGTGLGWALYELARHPESQARLADEVEDVLAGRVPGLADTRRLPFTRMVVDETLRLHPPIWLFPRDSVTDDEILGHHVPAGTSVFQVPYVTHRHPEHWPQPEAFRPDRFDAGAESTRPRCAYLPFGAGQRQCIGNQMALLQMHLTIAMVVQRYRLRLVPDHGVDLATLVSLRPRDGLRLRVEPRARGL